LLACFPATASGQGDHAFDGYELAVGEIPAEFVAVAVERFLSGKVPGQHTAFAPAPPQLATEAREHWYRHLDEVRRERDLKALPAPDVVHSPESQERVRRQVEQVVAKLADSIRTDEAAPAGVRRAVMRRTNAAFAPSFEPEDMRRRLWEVGDVDADGDMGGVR
jgi:hypothetical protein